MESRELDAEKKEFVKEIQDCLEFRGLNHFELDKKIKET